jgi:hypothetical protein
MKCHVEGCRWATETCGLARMGWAARENSAPGQPDWHCGARRAVVIINDSLDAEGLHWWEVADR